MTIGGWIILTISIVSVTALMVWCLWKVFTTGGTPSSDNTEKESTASSLPPPEL